MMLQGKKIPVPFNAALFLLVLCLAILTSVPAAYAADRVISQSDYLDRLEGMWVGEMLGNYAGRQNEGNETITAEGPNWVPAKSITQYNVPWSYILQGTWFQWNTTPHVSPSQWQADDDTCLEFVYAHALQSQPTLTVPERTTLWTDGRIDGWPLYFANKRAWTQMNTYGKTAAEAGLARYNIDGGWSIDAQITTEVLGSLAVGMRQQAANLAGDLGGITNEGFPVHAAQFYAAMYADAPFTPDVETIVARGLEVVPTGSWTRAIIEEAQALHADAGTNWLADRTALLAFVNQRGRGDRFWVEAASNVGMTTLAILHGQGDFKTTVELGVRGGEDSDCNPATAGGLIGMMIGKAAMQAQLVTHGLTLANIPTNYEDSDLIQLPTDVWTSSGPASEVMTIFQNAVETQIVAGGGSTAGGNYTVPDDPVVTGDVSDPTGPIGLVGEVLTLGGQVDVVVRRNGAVISDNSANDRTDQGRLIDGVSDLSFNGVLPFRTYDGGTGSQVDTYELHFLGAGAEELDINFEKLVLYEGDIKYNSNNYGEDNFTLIGGYFQQGGTLTVEVEQDGVWVEVTNLALSEALVDREYFQTIELTFDEIEGQAIRVFGSAGGTQPFTSLTEIEAFGVVPELDAVPEPAGLALVGVALLALRKRRS